VTSPYQVSNTPADPRHSSRLGIVQRFYLFEVLIVVTIQAFIFAALSAIYIGSAIEPGQH